MVIIISRSAPWLARELCAKCGIPALAMLERLARRTEVPKAREQTNPLRHAASGLLCVPEEEEGRGVSATSTYHLQGSRGPLGYSALRSFITP
jgi:hypothetical protein